MFLLPMMEVEKALQRGNDPILTILMEDYDNLVPNQVKTNQTETGELVTAQSGTEV